jgi:UDP-N-acetylglucosamine--N-acetylmuramyl-(pentapeptide) pyrophosphoryl-undecaprenol N-acetylglucosamine transferase
VRGVRGKQLLQKLLAPLLLVRAVLQAVSVIRVLRPGCVLGTGGFVAGPGGLAARLIGVPLVVHEQNAVAGTTNRLLARVAGRILLGLPGPFAGDPRAHFVGNPVRAAIATLPAPAQRFSARTGERPRLLVLGGSQGARVLNEVVPEALARMDADICPEVLHQCGAAGQSDCKARYAALGLEARVEAFIADMAAAYAWADLVVCRAGALTVSELAAAGLGAVLVPLPGAIDDHQNANARWLEDAGAALRCQQAEFTPAWLADTLQCLRPAQLRAMAERARELARPAAADDVARTCLEMMR